MLVEKVIHRFLFNAVLLLLMSSLLTNVGYACITKKSITYENNHSCKHRLFIVMRLHIECNLSFAFLFFHCHSLPCSFSTTQRQEIAVIFSFSSWATLGENCLLSMHREVNLENKRRKLRWDGY